MIRPRIVGLRRSAATVAALALALVVVGGGAANAADQPVTTIKGSVVSTTAGQSTTGVTVSATTQVKVNGVPTQYQQDAQVAVDGTYTLNLDYATNYDLSVGEWSGVSYNLGTTKTDAVAGQTQTCDVRAVPSTAASNWPTYVPSTFACSASQVFDAPVVNASLATGNQAVDAVVTLDKPDYVPGEAVTVSLAAIAGTDLQSWIGKQVLAFVYSTPRALSAAPLTVSSAGTINVAIPTDLAAGAHKIALYDTFGNLIGWSGLQVAATVATGTTAAVAAASTSAAATLPETGASGTLELLLTALVLVGLGSGAVMYRTRRGREGAGTVRA
jgi:hypothetical protein